MTDVKKLEKLEKKQEEKVRLRKGWTENAKKRGFVLEAIEKAQAEEDKAIAVLEKIREDKQIFKYVYHNQPAEIAKIAEALNLPPEIIKKRIKKLRLIDFQGEIYSDWDGMLAIKREEAEIKREEWEKKRKDMVKRWSEIAEKNPELTPEELKAIYIRHYPGEDEDIERYLEERDNQKDIAKYEDKELKYCENCKQWVTPTEGSGGAVGVLIVIGFVFIFFGIFFGLALILGILMIIVGIIYGIIKAGSGDRCPICNSQNWGKPPKEGRE